MEAETDPRLSDPSRAAPGAAEDDGGGVAERPAVLPYASAVTLPYDSEDHDLAVSSLLCGLFACAPFLTGILSLCFGVAVLRHARRLRGLDLTLAVLGVAAGGLNLAFWIAFVSAGFFA